MDFDFDKLFEGTATDMMPRQQHHVQRGAAVGMQSVDDVIDQTTDIDNDYDAEKDTDKAKTITRDRAMEMADPNSFEMISKSSTVECDIPQEEILKYAAPAVDQDGVVAAIIANATGGIGIHSDQPDESIEDGIGEWITDANQEFLDRTGNGERWIEVVNDLARRFSEFFDGSYEAFDFAADAFGRRAWEMGLVESQAMADSFDKTGQFVLTENIKIPSLKYRGRNTLLTEGTDIRVFLISERGRMIKLSR